MSESEAKRLGLAINEIAASMGTTTSSVTLRTAVAKDVNIGGLHFKNVSFAVLEDKEPFSFLEPVKRGIIGLPLILGFRTLRWYADGPLEIGGKSRSLDVHKSNIHFEDDQFVIETTVQQQRLLGTLDTGAETTDVFAAFAEQFASLLKQTGKRDSIDLKGIGGTETLDAIAIPDLMLNIGGPRSRSQPCSCARSQKLEKVLQDKCWPGSTQTSSLVHN